jgi:hypothetical protein
MVREVDIAWGALAANDLGIHVEHAGRAMETDWEIGAARLELQLSARLAAGICRRWSIPVRSVDALGILEGRSGITCHSWITDAKNAARLIPPEARTPLQTRLASASGDHQDPGGPLCTRWPMARFLDDVREATA